MDYGKVDVQYTNTEKPLSPADAISSALDRLNRNIEELYDLLSEVRGEPCSPKTSAENKPRISLAEVLKTTPQAIDNMGERIHSIKSDLREILF